MAKTKKTAKRKTARAKTKTKTKTKAKKATKRKPNAQFMKPMQPSVALAQVVGTKALPRTQVIKKVWMYIKKKGLQDKVNRRNIRADEVLVKVFNGKKVVSMFEMTKLLNKHLSA